MGKIYIVATPIGNLSDITYRALEILKKAALIAAEDTRRTGQLLNHFEIRTPVVSYHKYNETTRGKELIERIIQEDINIAVVSDAGTPCISDPGCVITSLAREHEVEVHAIPGPSAVISALSVCGFVYNSFSFMGFIPRKKKEKDEFYQKLLQSEIDTFVMYESPNRICQTLEDIQSYIPESLLFVVNDITKLHERSYWGPISDVRKEVEANEKASLGEYTLVLQRKSEFIPAEREYMELPIEALLVKEMADSDCSLKEAINMVSNRYKEISKNDAYKASLKLKELI